MFFVACYAVFMLVSLIDMLKLQRRVVVEDRQLHGYVMIKGNKYLVPFRSQKTAVALPVTDPIAFLLVSTTEQDECFATALVKLSTCISLLVFMWGFNFLEPFNIENLKLAGVIGSLFFSLVLVNMIKGIYTESWVSTLGDFKYHPAYDLNVYVFVLITVGLFSSSYIKAVKNYRELELTI